MRATDEYPGAALGLPAEGANAVAGLGVRFAAAAVDLLLLSVAGHYSETWLFSVVAVVGLVTLPVRWGTTVGMAVWRLRFVPVIDGVALTEQRGLTVLTAVGRAFLWLCWPLWFAGANEDRRTVNDRWTRTVVVEW